MNSMDIANGLIFQGLGIHNESFEDRIISQKKIYLLQQIGTDLGYNYNWYIRGPYSPSLTTYIYNNLDYLEEQKFEGYSLSTDVVTRIGKINDLSTFTPKSLQVSSWYELLASLSYLHANKISWDIQTQDDLILKLREQKPKYSEDQCNDAIVQLKNILAWSLS